jgi:hypothetical protein
MFTHKDRIFVLGGDTHHSAFAIKVSALFSSESFSVQPTVSQKAIGDTKPELSSQEPTHYLGKAVSDMSVGEEKGTSGRHENDATSSKNLMESKSN